MRFLKRPSELSRPAWAAFLVLWGLTILGLSALCILGAVWLFALMKSGDIG